mmetsp:Transcript_16484/g.38167  ORF Transcript_16484/g.38167 Transcript_16484/m.38167 type:complete len:109 (+) Transcript_16484:1-327(+)
MLHRRGVKKYLDGDWAEAKLLLELMDRAVASRVAKLAQEAQQKERQEEGVEKPLPGSGSEAFPGAASYGETSLLGDGPSRTLLEYMARFGFVAPEDWDPSQGRALESK